MLNVHFLTPFVSSTKFNCNPFGDYGETVMNY